VIERMIPPLAVWAVGKMLETHRVQRALHRVDETILSKKRKATQNASNNRVWLAAGAAVMVLGISLLARAAKK
jgi:hypothetical protein